MLLVKRSVVTKYPSRDVPNRVSIFLNNQLYSLGPGRPDYAEAEIRACRFCSIAIAAVRVIISVSSRSTGLGSRTTL